MSGILRWTTGLVAAVAVAGLDGALQAQTVDFGGPDSVGNTILSDRQQVDALFELESLQPYFAWKDRLAEDTGLSFGIDYTAVGLYASSSLSDKDSSGGIARLFGSWDLVGRGTPDSGALVFKLERRDGYSGIPPSGFALAGTGYVGLYEAPFSDQGWRLTNLYWRQRLNDDRRRSPQGFLTRPTTSTPSRLRVHGPASTTSRSPLAAQRSAFRTTRRSESPPGPCWGKISISSAV